MQLCRAAAMHERCARRILSAQVCTFDNATCGSFTALNQRGYLTVQVRNIGFAAAAFTTEARPSLRGVVPRAQTRAGTPHPSRRPCWTNAQLGAATKLPAYCSTSAWPRRCLSATCWRPTVCVPQVINCTGGILPILAQQASIAAQASTNLTFQMYASNTSAQATNACNVTLLDSQVSQLHAFRFTSCSTPALVHGFQQRGVPGLRTQRFRPRQRLTHVAPAQSAVVDRYTFGFALNATQFSATPVQSSLTTATGANAAGSALTGCRVSCPLGLGDFACYLRHFSKCWHTLLRFLLILLAVVAAGALCGCAAQLPRFQLRRLA